MVGLGTIANVSGIIAGGLIGLLLKNGLKQRYQDAVVKALGLSTIFIGAVGVLPGMLVVENGRLSGVSMWETLAMIVSMALGALVGEWINLEDKLERLGAWLKKKATRGEDSTFIQGFVTASLTVCIGAMAIVGSIQDGLMGDPSVLFTKTILDTFIIIFFAAAYGKGAIFSALPVGVLQGTVTACAVLLAPIFSDAVIASLSYIGSILIFCVGVNLSFGQKFKVANMLPALVFAGAFAAILAAAGLS